MVDERDVVVGVLAAGSGRRFGAQKQFEELKPGLRLVDVAVATARAVSDRVVLALPENTLWEGDNVTVVVGGATRIGSTRSVLAVLDPMPSVLVVHDAAHPLVTDELIWQLVDAVAKGADAAVPVLPLVDVVKKVSSSGELTTLGRDGLGIAQAPMAFSARALANAFATGSDRDVWEDSMLIEESGGTVVGIPGSARNLHVVTRDDLELARRIWPWSA